MSSRASSTVTNGSSSRGRSIFCLAMGACVASGDEYGAIVPRNQPTITKRWRRCGTP